ncbi:Heme-binding protein [Frankia sp. AiPs1]|uniref:GlcG/HbpS family heme-binding protein n=1 Tax=Frankia sp. AiPa1 TaxID=573492 RepID=UPI00202B5C7D|nr:heme-binding protein [Frankia sp. AiPa1]MCL9760855.1 heme-binding protein [Frankia sp. AiPa1]
MTVSLEDARRIIAAGERYAIHLGQPVNIAVVDHAGILVAHVRMDNARLGTADISVDRACAARASAMPAVPARLVRHGGDEGSTDWAVAGTEAALVHGGHEDDFDPDFEAELDEHPLPGDNPARAGTARHGSAVYELRGLDRAGRAAEAGLARPRAVGERLSGSGLNGAVPLWRDGMVVGAVGVSGGPTPHDEAIARAAAAAY